eukprot:6212304-Pleurochrysis_carterae.AAC.2
MRRGQRVRQSCRVLPLFMSLAVFEILSRPDAPLSMRAASKCRKHVYSGSLIRTVSGSDRCKANFKVIVSCCSILNQLPSRQLLRYCNYLAKYCPLIQLMQKYQHVQHVPRSEFVPMPWRLSVQRAAHNSRLPAVIVVANNKWIICSC